MSNLSKLKQPHIWPLLVLALADSFIYLNAAIGLRLVGALLLLLYLPGWVWLSGPFKRSLSLFERWILAIGLSLTLTILVALVSVYLPGTLSLPKLLLLLNGITLFGLLHLWLRRETTAPPTPPRRIPVSLLLIALIGLLAVMLRLFRLGYAEFHEDEAEALMLGVRLLQGEDYALFLHRKGPAQMLLPVALWLTAGYLTEFIARFPFALSSLLSAAVIYLLGRRWFQPTVGMLAALFWLINGYAFAFGRMVQYQTLIFFLGPLAIYCLYLAWKEQRPHFQFLAALFLAISLLAHFDALLLLPVAAYLAWQSVIPDKSQERDASPSTSPYQPLTTGLLALALFVALLAAFYVPYMVDQEFQNTIDYLTESRVKPGLLYNNLPLLLRLDRDYSSRFYLFLLVLGFIFYVWQQRQQAISKQKPTLTPLRSIVLSPYLLVALLLLSASTVCLPQWWQLGPVNLAVVPWLVLGIILFTTAPSGEGKAAWLMFGAPFLGYTFLVDDPRTHLYIMYPGAALIAGAGWGTILGHRLATGGQRSDRDRSRFLPYNSLRRATVAIVLTVLITMITLYTGLIFLQSESVYSQLKSGWDGSLGQWVYDDIPKAREYFGYPKREGWKAVGALRAKGEFPGDFRSVNEDFIIPIWYNYGQARSCYDTPAQIFVRMDGLPEPAERDGYALVAEIERENDSRLQIFSRNGEMNNGVHSYDLLDFIGEFDRQATPQGFTQQNQPASRLDTQFGPNIVFTGYDLPARQLKAGDILYLDLYWQALHQPEQDYRAFVHLTDGTTLWSQQDDNPACRLPTSIWRSGQHSVGQFRLQLPAEIPPGQYSLVIGLYRADTLQRLQISGGAGKAGDDFLWLGDVEVAGP